MALIAPSVQSPRLASEHHGQNFGEPSLTAGVLDGLYCARWWRESRDCCCMKKDDLKIAGWARAEQRRKIWAERRARFSYHVRGTFVLLLFMAFCVFLSNHQVENQIVAFERIHHPLNALPGSFTSDRLRQNALDYQKQVDDITK